MNLRLRGGFLFAGAIFLIGVLFSPQLTYAADCQSSASGNWSVVGSWTCGQIPQSGDTVTILNTHSITLDSNAAVASITINTGGTLTGGSGNTLTVSGTATVNGGTISPAAGGLNIIAGTFTQSSGTLSTASGSLNLDSASAGSGVFTLKAVSGSNPLAVGGTAAPATLNVNGAIAIAGANISLKATDITSNTSGTITTTTSGDISLDGSGILLFQANISSVGNISIGRNVAFATVSRASTAQLRLTNGTAGVISIESTGSIGSGPYPINNSLTSSANNYVTASSTVFGDVYLDNPGGTFKLGNVYAKEGSIYIGKNNIPGGIIKLDGSSLRLGTDGYTITLVSSGATGIGSTFYPLDIYLPGGASSIMASTTGNILIDSTGDLRFARTVASGSITIGKYKKPSSIMGEPFQLNADDKSLNLSATGNIGSSAQPIRLIVSAASTLNTMNATSAVSGNVYIDSMGGNFRLGNFSLADGNIVIGTILQPGNLVTTQNLTAKNISIVSDGGITINNNITSTEGDLTLTADNNNDLSGAVVHNSGVISASGGGDITIRSGSTDAGGSLSSGVSLGTVTTTGNLSVSAGSGSITSSSSALTANDITLIAKQGVGSAWTYLNVNSSGTVSANSTVNSGTGSVYLTRTGGDLNIASILVDATAGQVGLKTLTSGNIILGDGINNLKKIISAGSLQFSKASGNTNYTLADRADVEVPGDLTIDSGVTLNAGSANMKVSGNWNNGGTFDSDSGTVVLNGSGSSAISGDNSFYNLTCTSAGKTIIFPDGIAQKIGGLLKLQGQSDNMITLKSDAGGTDGLKTGHEGKLTLDGTADIQSIKIYDIDATGAGTPIAISDSENGGNITGWGPLPSTIRITPVGVSLTAGNSQDFQAETLDQFGSAIAPLVPITWSLSNSSLGTIDSNGRFVSNKAGQTTVIARSDIISGDSSVTVVNKQSSGSRGSSLTPTKQAPVATPIKAVPQPKILPPKLSSRPTTNSTKKEAISQISTSTEKPTLATTSQVIKVQDIEQSSSHRILAPLKSMFGDILNFIFNLF